MMLVFGKRNLKELIRDPLTLVFGVAFPVVLLVLLYAIGRNIPAEAQNPMGDIMSITPGIAVFGLSFVTLLSALLISKDREDALMVRLLNSPMRASDYILGYTLPMLPAAILQSVITLFVGVILGMKITFGLLVTVGVLAVCALNNIGMGLLFGTVLGEKQVGSICGALFTNISAWLSGIWFDTAIVGGVFDKIARMLPFVHAVNAARAACAGEYGSIMKELVWVIGYSVVVILLAILIFRKKMKKNM